MLLNELTNEALDRAQEVVGDDPVIMVNLLWFRNTPQYPVGFADPQPDARAAYYTGYVQAFRAAADEAGVTPQLIYAGVRLAGLVAGPDDDWDDIAVVRYERLADLRTIVESERYRRTASPHRLAAIANWRFVATRAA